MNQYKIREESLKTLGFRDYRAYLASDLWRTIKADVLLRSGGLCECCRKNPAYTGHHVTYTVGAMNGLDKSQVVAICRPCHKNCEFDSRGEKLVEANTIAARLHGRSIAKAGGRASKKFRKKSRPACRCCGQQKRKVGRDGICLQCFKKFRVNVHRIAARRDRKAISLMQAVKSA